MNQRFMLGVFYGVLIYVKRMWKIVCVDIFCFCNKTIWLALIMIQANGLSLLALDFERPLISYMF